jgi:hypothetical protein
VLQLIQILQQYLNNLIILVLVLIHIVHLPILNIINQSLAQVICVIFLPVFKNTKWLLKFPNLFLNHYFSFANFDIFCTQRNTITCYLTKIPKFIEYFLKLFFNIGVKDSAHVNSWFNKTCMTKRHLGFYQMPTKYLANRLTLYLMLAHDESYILNRLSESCSRINLHPFHA